MTLEDIQNIDFKQLGSESLAIRIFLVVMLCAAVCAGFYFGLIKGQIETLKASEAKELTLKASFEAKQKKAAKLEPYKQQLAEMKKTFGSMLKSLPDKTEVESLLVEISRAGSSNNLKIEKFRPTGEIKREFYAEYPIDMTLKGSYGELTGFVSSVAALQRIVTLHEVDIKPSEKSKDGEVNEDIDVTLVAKTYRYLSK